MEKIPFLKDLKKEVEMDFESEEEFEGCEGIEIIAESSPEDFVWHPSEKY